MKNRFLISSVAWQGLRHSEAIAEVRAAGFGGVEILCKPGHFEPGNRAHMDDVLSALAEWPDALVTFHAPFYMVDPAASDPDAWDWSMGEMMLALEAASRLRARSMTVHVRSRETAKTWDDANLDAVRRSLDRLAPVAAERNMTLAVENLPPPCFTSEAADLLRLIEEYPAGVVGACIDMGHAHLAERAAEIARMLASRAFVSHLHDNIGAGHGDKHMIPGGGTIPWAGVVEAMREFRGQPVMEVVMTGTLGETLANVERAIVETGLTRLVSGIHEYE